MIIVIKNTWMQSVIFASQNALRWCGASAADDFVRLQLGMWARDSAYNNFILHLVLVGLAINMSDPRTHPLLWKTTLPDTSQHKLKPCAMPRKHLFSEHPIYLAKLTVATVYLFRRTRRQFRKLGLVCHSAHLFLRHVISVVKWRNYRNVLVYNSCHLWTLGQDWEVLSPDDYVASWGPFLSRYTECGAVKLTN